MSYEYLSNIWNEISSLGLHESAITAIQECSPNAESIDDLCPSQYQSAYINLSEILK
jgi:hypothetical protein